MMQVHPTDRLVTKKTGSRGRRGTRPTATRTERHSASHICTARTRPYSRFHRIPCMAPWMG